MTERLYWAEDATDFLSQPWKLILQPTYERQANGSSTGCMLLQSHLKVDPGVLLWTRFEWPVPPVNRGVPGWQFALLLQQFSSFAGDSDRARVNQLKLQPYVTKLLPHSWYIQTKPIVELNFVSGTSSVPLDLVIGKLLGARWTSVSRRRSIRAGPQSKSTTSSPSTSDICFRRPCRDDEHAI